MTLNSIIMFSDKLKLCINEIIASAPFVRNRVVPEINTA